MLDESCVLIFFLMLSCSVFTPYYSEIVLYSMDELLKKNEDGISLLFYLQKIYPGTFYFHSVEVADIAVCHTVMPSYLVN